MSAIGIAEATRSVRILRAVFDFDPNRTSLDFLHLRVTLVYYHEKRERERKREREGGEGKMNRIHERTAERIGREREREREREERGRGRGEG